MIACAEWLGRDHTTCTRKPDGCVCEPKEPVCTCSDGPYHYSTCPMYKEGHDPFAVLGKAMTKHAPTPNPYCGIKGAALRGAVTLPASGITQYRRSPILAPGHTKQHPAPANKAPAKDAEGQTK